MSMSPVSFVFLFFSMQLSVSSNVVVLTLCLTSRFDGTTDSSSNNNNNTSGSNNSFSKHMLPKNATLSLFYARSKRESVGKSMTECGSKPSEKRRERESACDQDCGCCTQSACWRSCAQFSNLVLFLLKTFFRRMKR